jgi:hypothetical protein
MPVYTTFKGGFGDAWAAANYFLRKSVETGEPTMVAALDPRIRMILPYLDSNGSIVEVNDAPDLLIFSHPTLTAEERGYPGPVPETVFPWAVVFAERYFPTKHFQWKKPGTRKVCYQLVPRYSTSNKVCPPGHIEKLLAALERTGFGTKAIGLPLTLNEIIEVCATSDFFVGVCSGMSHVCHSVGTPVHLIRNGYSNDTIRRCHSGNPYFSYANVDEFLKTHEWL